MFKVYEKRCPCKECAMRKIDCHATCKAYDDWKKSAKEIVIDYVNYKERRRTK
jgi:hypothetical protein